MPSEAIRRRTQGGTQRYSEALRGTERHSEALRGTQRYSEVLRGTQRYSSCHYRHRPIRYE